MKILIFLLSVGALLGIDYAIAPGITWADVAWGCILIISIIKLVNHKWEIDYFTKYSMMFIPCMIISSIGNFEFTNTVFINFFRNYTAGIVVYFALSNVIESKKDIKIFLLFGIAFLLQFMWFFFNLVE